MSKIFFVFLCQKACCSEQGIVSCRTHGRQELSGPADPPDKCKTCRGCDTLEREDIMKLESIDGADVEKPASECR
jgi:hypothetical protein